MHTHRLLVALVTSSALVGLFAAQAGDGHWQWYREPDSTWIWRDPPKPIRPHLFVVCHVLYTNGLWESDPNAGQEQNR